MGLSTTTTFTTTLCFDTILLSHTLQQGDHPCAKQFAGDFCLNLKQLSCTVSYGLLARDSDIKLRAATRHTLDNYSVVATNLLGQYSLF